METVVITCSECTKRFKGKPGLAGKKIKCPFCKEAFVVPKDLAAAAPAPAKVEAKKPIVFDDDDDPGDYGVTALDMSARCPNCANPMADEKAFVCLYCGYNTLTRTWGKTEKLVGHTTGDYVRHQMTAYICAFLAGFFAVLILFYDMVVPYLLDHSSWAEMFDAESLRLWFTVFSLFIFWALGMVIYKRLVINPTPPSLKKE